MTTISLGECIADVYSHALETNNPVCTNYSTNSMLDTLMIYSIYTGVLTVYAWLVLHLFPVSRLVKNAHVFKSHSVSATVDA